MLALLKLGCVALYAVALAALAGRVPPPLAGVAEALAALFVALHVLELPFAWKALRAAPGALAAHLAQALLFGVLHWLPLVRAQRRQGA
jgi:uncharacterized protein YhhL (DUF1145 family)